MGRVELKDDIGKSARSGKEVDLKRYRVIFDDYLIGFKEKSFGSPVNLIVKLNEDDVRLVHREVNDILFDDSVVNELMGFWDHELKSNEDETEGEIEHDIFDP